MEFNDNARLDTSQVEDVRSSGGGGGRMGGGMGRMGFPSGGGGGGMGLPKVGGGLGLVIMIAVIAFSMCSGGGSGVSTLPGASGVQAESEVSESAELSQCKTGADANANSDCGLVAVINSVQAFWAKHAPANGFQYRQANTVLFREGVSTGCGAASSAMGPFYCPADEKAYFDLSFFDEFKTKFGANGGPFARAYVVAHEYGHHIQNLLGTSEQVQRSGDRTGPDSAAVRLELQADCYAGVWAANAQADGFITSISETDIVDGLDAAARVGDDFIQKEFQGRIDREAWTHGSSAQRQKWFKQGLSTGDMTRCDTFSGGI
jgi:uncharacterized protein